MYTWYDFDLLVDGQKIEETKNGVRQTMLKVRAMA